MSMFRPECSGFLQGQALHPEEYQSILVETSTLLSAPLPFMQQPADKPPLQSIYLQDGDYYTEAQCEAVVLCGNNHWIIMPNLTRSIQIDLWPGGPKSYLWQPVIASPVIQQTKMEEPQTAVSALLGLVSVAY